MKFLSKIFTKNNKAQFEALGNGSVVSDDEKFYVLCSSKDEFVDVDQVSKKILEKFNADFQKNNIKGCLRETLQEINTEVFAERKTEISVVCYYQDEKELIIAHVGNAGLYVYSDGELKQITDEDTEAYQLFKMGIIDYDRLKSHPFSKKISNALGKNKVLIANMHEYFFTQGDKILIADAEFLENFSLTEMEDFLSSPKSVAEIAKQLLEKSGEANFVLKKC